MGKIKIMKKQKSITGKFLYCDVKNANGRIYTKECAFDILQQAKKDIDEENLLGELGYSDRPEIALKNVSHRVSDIKFDPINNALEGTIEIFEGTPKGKQLLEMIDNDLQKFNELFVIRPRGTGTVNEKGEVENYTLYSFDIVEREKDAFNIEENSGEPIFKIE